MRFIDLFCGLGGFHTALAALGHRCVFACDIKPDIRTLYEANYGVRPAGDINKIAAADIPDHDILAAGFPCQAFSIAGDRRAFSDPRGELIFAIFKVLEAKRPKYFLLENVKNIMRINRGKVWEFIIARLRSYGYSVNHTILSPHQFGIPQNRPRVFIAGSLESDIDLPPPNLPADYVPLQDFLGAAPPNARPMTGTQLEIMDLYEQVLAAHPPTSSIYRARDYPQHPAARRILRYPEYWHEMQTPFRGLGISYSNRACVFNRCGPRLHHPGLAPTIVAAGYRAYALWQRRLFTAREEQRLMSLESLRRTFPDSKMHEALGNAVSPVCAQAAAAHFIK